MASKILGMFWMDMKDSSFWRYNPICVQISDGLLGRAFSLGDFPWRKSEGDPFSFPNRIWKLRHRNWWGRWETGSVGYKGPWPVDARESSLLAHWFSASSDAPALPRGTRPVHLRPGVEDQVSTCALCRQVDAKEWRQVVHQNWFLFPGRPVCRLVRTGPLLGTWRQR